MGMGVLENDKEAIKWFRKAAEQGDKFAQWHLGVMYEKGEGVLESYTEAYAWILIADYMGNAVAKQTMEVFKERFNVKTIAAGQKRASELIDLIEKMNS
jgi:TPR repeat protein